MKWKEPEITWKSLIDKDLRSQRLGYIRKTGWSIIMGKTNYSGLIMCCGDSK